MTQPVALSALPDDLLERAAEEGARRVALVLLERAEGRLAALEAGDDPEALHDFRVAIRRLRSWLRSFPDELGRERMHKAEIALGVLTQNTGGARDAEVQLEWLAERRGAIARSQRAGFRHLEERLTERTERAYAELDRGVAEGFRSLAKELRGHLREYRARIQPAGSPGGFAATLVTRLEEQCDVLASDLEAIDGPSDLAQAHRARIEVKRLRYLLEPIAAHVKGAKPAIKRLKALQEVLGEMNDLRVFEQTLARESEREALLRVQESLDLARAGDTAAVDKLGRAGRERERGMLAVATLVGKRMRKLFAELANDWLPNRATHATAPVARVCQALGSAAGASLEVERKYLLRGLPTEARQVEPTEIEQGWLPGEQVRERLRRAAGPVDERFTRTVKLGSGLRRAEFEEEIHAELFSQLWPLTAGCRVRKRRYRIEVDGHTWEIDEFLDRELFLAEVEFPADDAEARAPIPAWLEHFIVREVTEDSRYTNLQLAR